MFWLLQQVQPATAAAALGVPGQTMVIHGGGRKSGGSGGGGTIIETFKCEVCNQIFASMNSLQSHISQVHEVGMNKRNKKPNSTLHCEYKYSGMSLAGKVYFDCTSLFFIIRNILISRVFFLQIPYLVILVIPDWPARQFNTLLKLSHLSLNLLLPEPEIKFWIIQPDLHLSKLLEVWALQVYKMEFPI